MTITQAISAVAAPLTLLQLQPCKIFPVLVLSPPLSSSISCLQCWDCILLCIDQTTRHETGQGYGAGLNSPRALSPVQERY